MLNITEPQFMDKLISLLKWIFLIYFALHICYFDINAQNIKGKEILYISKEDMINYKIECIVDSTPFTIDYTNSYTVYNFSNGLIRNIKYYHGEKTDDDKPDYRELNYHIYQGKVVSSDGDAMAIPVGADVSLHYNDTNNSVITYRLWNEYKSGKIYYEDTTLIYYYPNNKIKSIVSGNWTDYYLYDNEWNWIGYFHSNDNITDSINKYGYQKFREKFIESNNQIEMKIKALFFDPDLAKLSRGIYINGLTATSFFNINKTKYKYLIIEIIYNEYIFYKFN